MPEEVQRTALVMDGNCEGMPLVSNLGMVRLREPLHRVVTLLEVALGQLQNQVHPAQHTLREATSLLRQQMDSATARVVPDDRGRMLAWQVRKVRDYIDSHISGRVLVADLCALVQCSDAHFSRSFKRTFGESPHAFLLRRRVELAAHLMMTTDATLSDIALRCGFSDQAHLSKHFRQAAGQTPAAWRRAHKLHHDEDETCGKTILPRASVSDEIKRRQNPSFSICDPAFGAGVA
jgi:AraC family transcriptional regulator